MGINANLLTMYGEVADIYFNALIGELYKSSTILDLMTKMKAKKLEQSNQLKGADLKLPTFDGFSGKEWIDDTRFLSSDEAKNDIWVNDRDEIDPKNVDGGNYITVMPSFLNVSLELTRSEMMVIQGLASGNMKREFNNHVETKVKKLKKDMEWGLAYSVWQGMGGDTDDSTYNAYYSYPLTVRGVSVAKPTRRQLEGIHSFIMNNTYVTKLYGYDSSTNAFFNAQVYDTDSVTTASDASLGYTDAQTNTAALLLATATAARTPGVPVILDMCMTAIRNMTVNREKPEIAIMHRNVYDLVARACAIMGATAGAVNFKESEEFIKMGYTDNIVINGVTFIPDDTVYRDATGTVTHAIPNRAIFFLRLSEFKFEAHRDYNFKQSEWKEYPKTIGVLYKTIDAALRFYTTNRWKQGAIYFPNDLTF